MSTERHDKAERYAHQLEDKGYSFQQIRKKVKERFGQTLTYFPHDKPGGNAAQRRLRQMKRGQIDAPAVRCACGNQLPPGREAGMLCDACLAAKWG